MNRPSTNDCDTWEREMNVGMCFAELRRGRNWLIGLTAFLIVGAACVDGRADEAKRSQRIALYGVFEKAVTNTKAYSNPFDFQVVELRTEFTAPSGKKTSFIGFYDGDGRDGQNGSVWKFRFMPEETGTYRYTWAWTDGTEGGSGSFDVIDTGLAGPLKVAKDNSWYFMTARGAPFHARPYGMHHYLTWTKTHRMASEVAGFKKTLQEKVIDHGYNMVMWPDMGDRKRRGTSSSDNARRLSGTPTDSWWIDTDETRRFSVAAFRANEDALAFCRDHGVYVITFAGMIDQYSHYEFSDFQVFLRYFVARMAAYSNTLGWSPVWEWMDIWKPDQVTQVMQFVHDLDPWKRPLTAHDNSYSTFTGWLGFSMRQRPARDIHVPNSRRAGVQQIPDPHGSGGIGDPFIDLPIIGSEDQWKAPNTDDFPGWVMPRNETEMMRSSWGTLMAGVIPLYDEWNAWTGQPGDGTGDAEVRRMFDFWYRRTEYRRYRQLNEMVWKEEEQIASGIPGEEYVIYDEDGGVIELKKSQMPKDRLYDVLWFNPSTGEEKSGEALSGGGSPRVRSPFPKDSVLFIKARSMQADAAGSALSDTKR